MSVRGLSTYVVSVVACEAIGLLGAVFTVPSIPTWYAALNKPFFTPPSWVFGPVWTLLYFLMGISLARIRLLKRTGYTRSILDIFVVQLLLNLLWSAVFFGAKQPLLALFIILGLWLSILVIILRVRSLDRWSVVLLAPYLAWVSFASALNLGIALLNR